MNWTDLLEALLFAAIVLPVLLQILGLLTGTQTQTVMAGALTAMTTYTFMRDEYGHTAWCAALTVFMLLVLRREHARKNSTKSPDSKLQV
ncbi:hypothetical protein [Streptomyces sp. NPDC002215]|uniref:hypothetical protein n=1 Tax=Streptomyces sp. NPDC002215 TaxID=3154412 RepID=UPI003324E3A3